MTPVPGLRKKGRGDGETGRREGQPHPLGVRLDSWEDEAGPEEGCLSQMR